jgi:SnoaL-like polyketide cyclase
MSTDQESTARRLEIFERLDFEGFNKQDWDLFGHIHTDDVIVEIQGERTEGIRPHLDGAVELFKAMPDTHIQEYLIKFGGGDWTCTVSRITGMGKPETKLVTIAKWRGEKVCEEYIYFA